MGKGKGKGGRNNKKTKVKQAKSSSSASEVEETAKVTFVPPKNGWLVELDEAQTAVKAASEGNKNQTTNAKAYLRVAIAACSLRKWKEGVSAATTGLNILESDLAAAATTNENEDSSNEGATKKQLLACQQEAQEGLAKIARDTKNCSDMASSLFKDVLKGNNVDQCQIEHQTFSNLNVLQWAALYGNSTVMEQAVAHGAALDYPVLQDADLGVSTFPAPEGSTALVLICASLAVYGKIGNAPGLMTPQVKKSLQGMEECGIALVQLGADTNKKLPNVNRRASSPMDPVLMWRQFHLFGHTAKQLAAMSRKPKLINAMKEMETKDDLIAKAHCRCGSRLPWLQCHAGPEADKIPIYITDKKDKEHLLFRYSPLAPCPCKLTKKRYWRCCWEQTAKPSYQDDYTGGLQYTASLAIGNNPVMKELMGEMARAKQKIIDSGGDLNQPVFSEMASLSNQERATHVANAIRKAPEMLALMVSTSPKPQTKIGSWDPMVVAGCIERLDNFFFWNDLHWQLDKTELLTRVKEWNEALEQYCQESGLEGAERKAVIEKHTANPCAPCGNPDCEASESEPKEFRRCSRCRKIAYCSQACQKLDWRDHKRECLHV